MYTIDTWREGDSVAVLVGETEIDLGQLKSDSSGDGEMSGTQAGISWSRNVIFHGQNLGFGEANDEKHLVQFTIPADHFRDNELFFGIRVALNEDGENSAGIDDLMMEAHYTCPEDRELVSSSSMIHKRGSRRNNDTFSSNIPSTTAPIQAFAVATAQNYSAANCRSLQPPKHCGTSCRYFSVFARCGSFCRSR